MIHRLFGTTNSSWSGAVRSCTNSRQVSWLKDLRPPPPSQSNASVAGARSTRAAGSLITVTRSCGICTRFPFTLSAVQCIGKRHLLFFCSVRPALYHKTAQNAIKNGILPFYKEGCRSGDRAKCGAYWSARIALMVILYWQVTLSNSSLVPSSVPVRSTSVKSQVG